MVFLYAVIVIVIAVLISGITDSSVAIIYVAPVLALALLLAINHKLNILLKHLKLSPAPQNKIETMNNGEIEKK